MAAKSWSDYGIETKGRSSGSIRTTCPQCSAHRKKKSYPCLHADLDKEVWFCHHCEWRGGLGTGVHERAQIQKVWRKPAVVLEPIAERPNLPEKALAWFATRGITDEVLLRNRVFFTEMYFPQVEDERSCIGFPYLDIDEIINVKYRTGDKLFRMEAGAQRVLYGLNDIGDTLVWVEGEMDKLSVEVAGIQSCVSVPDGAPAADSKNYDSKFDWISEPALERVKVHVIAVDADAPGTRLREELVRRLGPERCRIVDWPEGCKDANDVLVERGAAALRGFIEAARELPIAGAHDAGDYLEDVLRVYECGIPTGVSSGWRTLDEFYRVRQGDLAIVTGAPNSGKSEWVDALMINVSSMHNWRWAVFSPEQGSPAEHIAKLAEKVTGKPFNPGPTERMRPDELGSAVVWLNEHVTLLDTPEPSLDNLLTIAKQLVLRRGVRGFVLDPWNEIEHARPAGMQETEYIGICLRKLRIFARSHQVATYVVAHPRMLLKDKDTGQYPVVGPYEISGSAHWHNKSDFCISIWRERGPEAGTDVQVHIQKAKSKWVGRLGMATLSWNRVTGRYSDINPTTHYYSGGK